MYKIPWWEITLGLSNLTLAGIVAWSTYKNAKKDRSVHIADKRSDWNKNFIDIVSEMQLLQEKILLQRLSTKSLNIEIDEEYQRLMFLSNKLGLMFNKDEQGYEIYKVETEIHNAIISKNLDKVLEFSKKLDKLAHDILGKQRKMIAELDSKNPLI
ncbi:hypothetical protein [Flagellimonas flava]|uniref:hypothetical protein n=1 Tax=Flagellimonas flava TaxID=570519 RepID=UPI003D64D450